MIRTKRIFMEVDESEKWPSTYEENKDLNWKRNHTDCSRTMLGWYRRTDALGKLIEAKCFWAEKVGRDLGPGKQAGSIAPVDKTASLKPSGDVPNGENRRTPAFVVLNSKELESS